MVEIVDVVVAGMVIAQLLTQHVVVAVAVIVVVAMVMGKSNVF